MCHINEIKLFDWASIGAPLLLLSFLLQFNHVINAKLAQIIRAAHRLQYMIEVAQAYGTRELVSVVFELVCHTIHTFDSILLYSGLNYEAELILACVWQVKFNLNLVCVYYFR